MASLVFFNKKDESLHLVQDYWKLNMMNIKDAYPCPLFPTSSIWYPKPR